MSSYARKAELRNTAGVDTFKLALRNVGKKTRVKFDWDCLKQDKITFTHGKIVNIYVVYEINLWNYVDISDPTLGNSLLRASTS